MYIIILAVFYSIGLTVDFLEMAGVMSLKELTKLAKMELKHKRGYLSIARSNELNSASSQFYILLKSLPELDGRFAVFGKVISGMNVVDSIKEEDLILEAKRL